MLYLPAISGAGARLIVELLVELLDELLLVFLFEPEFVFELELEVDDVVDLQPIATPSSNTKAMTAGCRDMFFIVYSNLDLTVGLYSSRDFLSTISAVSIVTAFLR